MRIRFFIAVVFVFFVSAIVFFVLTINDFKISDINRENKPSMIVNNVRGVVYNKFGKREYNYDVDKIEYYKILDSFQFIDPKISSYDENTNVKNWEITSNKGFFSVGDLITLYDNVIINNYKIFEQKTQKYRWIKTPYLEFDLIKNEIRTDKKIDYFDFYGSEFHGKSFIGNIKTNKFEFNGEGHAVIQPEDFSNNDN